MATTQTTTSILDLPEEMIDKILSLLPYDQLANLRAVNQAFNIICSDKLNKGFVYVNQYQRRCLKAVKAKLPRRESERRHHPLARHIDILMAVETRLSMLSMTFCKYIDNNLCCFIPGKVLDEALKVLRIVSNCSNPLQSSGPYPQYPILPRPHDFLQEYRDISSMAMEHFDDRILPRIREKVQIENSSVYCIKQKPSEGRHLFFNARHLEVKNLQWFIHGPRASTSAGNGNVSNQASVPVQEKPDTATTAEGNAVGGRTSRTFQMNKIKFKTLHQSVEKLSRDFRQATKKIKLDNVMLKKQMVRQKVTIKHLRRELRETRAAMSVMSKDLNQMKVDLTPSRGTKRKRKDEDCD